MGKIKRELPSGKDRKLQPNVKLDDYLTEEKLMLLSCWARDYPIGDIAEKIGISRGTLYQWMKRDQRIKDALSQGREVIDYKVENALLKRALGYKTKEIKIKMKPNIDGSGNMVQMIEEIEKEVPPDVGAIFGWLNNRQPDKWKRNRDNFIELKEDDSNITINVFKGGQKQNINPKDSSDEEWDEVLAEAEEDWDES